MPITEHTIAFIGKPGKLVSAIAKCIAAYNYRLLFCGGDPEDYNTLQKTIRQQYPCTKMRNQSDSYCSCWEADVIFLTDDSGTKKDFLDRVQPVVAQKVVVSIGDHSVDKEATDLKKRSRELQQFLPYSRIVVVTKPFSDRTDNHDKSVLVAGENDEAIAKISELIEAAGFNPGEY